MTHPLPATVRTVLLRRWRSLVSLLGISAPQAEAAWTDVTARYGEDGRFYHTLTHVHHVLTKIEQLHADPTPALRLAAWLHDVVYDPRCGDNEAESAAYARRLLRTWQQPETLADHVAAMILATRTHEAEDAETAVLLDADLAILGAAWPAYAAYAQAIRREYAFVPLPDFQRGRGAVLHQFLQRPFIYHTPAMRAEHETAARANLRREISRLQADVG